jgi:hypothetical protein
MGFGDAWNSAWNGATGKAKQLGSSIANGYDSTKKWTAEKATQAKDWAVEKGTQAKNYAVEKGTQAKNYAVEKGTQAKNYAVEKGTQAKNYAVKQGTNLARGAEKKALQGGEALGGYINRGLNAAGNAKDSLAKKANDARNKVRSWFGKEPVGEACPTCSGKAEPKTDKEADGYYMGEGCKPKKTLDEAKASPTKPDPKNACCKGKSGQRTIYYVNGINTTRTAHCTTLREIANSTCANVIGIYNATEGFFKDGLQTGGDRQLINKPAVNTVSNTVYNEVQAGRKPEIWAHSQGGAVTSLGLYSADNRLQMAGNEGRLAGTKVTSFGSAAPRWVDGPKYEHYVHANDITPVSLGLGDNAKSAAARGGKGANIHRFTGNPKDGWVDEGKPGFKKGVLTPTSNHGIEETYIAKRDRDKGGCGQSFNAAH